MYIRGVGHVVWGVVEQVTDARVARASRMRRFAGVDFARRGGEVETEVWPINM